MQIKSTPLTSSSSVAAHKKHHHPSAKKQLVDLSKKIQELNKEIKNDPHLTKSERALLKEQLLQYKSEFHTIEKSLTPEQKKNDELRNLKDSIKYQFGETHKLLHEDHKHHNHHNPNHVKPSRIRPSRMPNLI